MHSPRNLLWPVLQKDKNNKEYFLTMTIDLKWSKCLFCDFFFQIEISINKKIITCHLLKKIKNIVTGLFALQFNTKVTSVKKTENLVSIETFCFPLPWCSLHNLLFSQQLQKNFYFHSYNCFGLPQEEKVLKQNLKSVSKMYLETLKRGIVKVCGTSLF